ncbi:MAG TPA: FHA domain-containing protein [Anaerolineaceae bacterium]|nr:FHA domain-containing protein [Anaerolineaceae bacterium]HPN51043.1 FHA domain-containing protein [Anaerolineaceae bacterium]
MKSLHRQIMTLLLILLICLHGQPAGAQTAGQAIISSLDLKAYPEFSFRLEVFDSNGRFLNGLKPDQVTLLEDEQERPLVELLEERRSLETLVVVNAAQPLGVRDARGVTRYDLLREGLKTWLSSVKAQEGDTFSLLNNQGQEANDLPDAQKLWAAIEAFKPDMRAETLSMDSLTRALTVPEGFDRRRVVLFITPVLQGADLGTLQGLAEEAKINHIRLSIWMAGGAQVIGSADAQAMEAAAVMTGGSFFAFSGSEPIPDPSSAFDPLAGVYLVHYRSGIITSGSHTLTLRIEKEGEMMVAGPLDFTLNVTPPNPIFLSPPPQITRSGQADEDGQPQALTPASQTLKMVVEFPDAHPRALRASRLFVDQKLVVENKKAPFDSFTWPLTAYKEDGRHILRLEVEDEMGLMGSSSELPVSITISLQMPEVLPEERRSNLWGITAAVLAFAALVSVLAVGWTIRTRSKNKKAATADMMMDESSADIFSTRAARSWPKKGAHEHSEAAMMGLEGAPTFNLGLKESTFGRDPTQATCVVTATGVDALHCRLRRMDDGSYWLYDENSVAGTWVNYAPLGKNGLQLHHGDRVAIGQAAFRFRLQNPRNLRRIQVKPYKDRL